MGLKGPTGHLALVVKSSILFLTKYVLIERTTVYGPSSELGLFHPLSRQRASPRNHGGHIRVRVRGWGSPNSNDWRKSLALCQLCVFFCNRRLAPLSYVPTKRHVKLTVSKCAICVFCILKKKQL
jgi:hypothetical protein